MNASDNPVTLSSFGVEPARLLPAIDTVLESLRSVDIEPVVRRLHERHPNMKPTEIASCLATAAAGLAMYEHLLREIIGDDTGTEN